MAMDLGPNKAARIYVASHSNCEFTHGSSITAFRINLPPQKQKRGGGGGGSGSATLGNPDPPGQVCTAWHHGRVATKN
jgi:hypothetical protein